MEQVLEMWPYAVTAIVAIVAALLAYEKMKVKGWKSGFKAMVVGINAAKKKLDEQGIDYKENLTTLIDGHVTDPKAKKLLESVITIVEREASASASDGAPDAGSGD